MHSCPPLHWEDSPLPFNDGLVLGIDVGPESPGSSWLKRKLKGDVQDKPKGSEERPGFSAAAGRLVCLGSHHDKRRRIVNSSDHSSSKGHIEGPDRQKSNAALFSIISNSALVILKFILVSFIGPFGIRLI